MKKTELTALAQKKAGDMNIVLEGHIGLIVRGYLVLIFFLKILN